MKLTSWGILSWSFQIEEKNPLKQGLKPDMIGFCTFLIHNWREESIKTRIETPIFDCGIGVEQNWREESIKTRIETSFISSNVCPYFHIEEKNPLKQGLKHWVIVIFRTPSGNWREESIKTRIETLNGLPPQAEGNPLKRRIH